MKIVRVTVASRLFTKSDFTCITISVADLGGDPRVPWNLPFTLAPVYWWVGLHASRMSFCVYNLLNTIA